MTAAHPARPHAGRILVDMTHCGRRTTGLERIAQELFSPQALAPLPVEAVTARDRYGMVLKQIAGLPAAALLDRRALVRCPGFPPSLPLTALALTEAGHTAGQAWLHALLAEPAREFPAFGAGLAFLPLLDAEDARHQLELRIARLDAERERLWPAATATYSPFAGYQRRAEEVGRTIPFVVLARRR